MNLEEEMRKAAQSLLACGRGSSMSQTVAEENLRRALASEQYMDAWEQLKQMAAKCAEMLCDAWATLEEAFRNILAAADFSYMEMMAKLAEEDMAVPDGREWQRDREREAIPREQARAAARYKAHRRMMTEHKARQHLRRRKYRSGANAGWY